MMSHAMRALGALGLLTVAFSFSTPNEARAVVFDASNLPPCFAQDSPFIPPLQQRVTIKLELHLCEEPNHVTAIFVGDRISPGERIALNWEGQFWRGYLQLTQSTNGGGNRQVDAEGWIQHMEPDPAPQFDFDDLTGGGTGDPFVETVDTAGGTVPHHGPPNDDYFIDFHMDEGRTLLGVNPGGGSPNVTERGWLLEIEGFHGNGPFEFFNRPKPFRVTLAPIPVPAAGWLMLAALAGLPMLRRFRSG